jgi:uncharacterized membrane protein
VVFVRDGAQLTSEELRLGAVALPFAALAVTWIAWVTLCKTPLVRLEALGSRRVRVTRSTLGRGGRRICGA